MVSRSLNHLKVLGMGTYILDSDLALRFLMSLFTDAMIILHRAYPIPTFPKEDVDSFHSSTLILYPIP